ncbi:MAG: hypothetical protein ACM31C_20505 [Acidobacteriota bacterium]
MVRAVAASPVASNKPHEQLRAIGAPRELIEWVRKLPADTAARAAWVDASRADWLPYLAVIRGIDRDAILRATCACAVEQMPALDGGEAQRVRAVLEDAAARGKPALATVEQDLSDLRFAIIAAVHGKERAAWMAWAELAFELARACSRGNPLVGIALAMRTLATSGGRPKHAELIGRLRDKLVLGG